ncbi:MAG TPA: hypothetical protein DCQ92_14150 [Verrucomicrobia subdivision 3 bacterium]|nr:hypothetical protein [Limisphaerales bacterium]
MKLIYKEDPREWRKSALLAALGLAILSSFLCWRRHLPINCWSVLAELILLMVIVAGLRPRWFRGWYRFSLWLGFHSSQFTGRCVLLLFFIFIVTLHLDVYCAWEAKIYCDSNARAMPEPIGICPKTAARWIVFFNNLTF